MSFSFWISDFLYHQYLTRYDYNLPMIKPPKPAPYALAHSGDILVMLLNVSYLFVFVALRPMSTAMVIAGRSVHLTTLFPGQA